MSVNKYIDIDVVRSMLNPSSKDFTDIINQEYIKNEIQYIKPNSDTNQTFIKEENDANYFNYVIDLSSPEIADAKLVDPNFVNELEKDLDTKFTPLSESIKTEFQNQQLMAAQQQQNAVMSTAAANRPAGFPVAQPQPGMPGMPGMPGAAAEPAYSVKNLEAACLKNISRIPITSKSRIFVVSKDLTAATAAMVSRINTKGDFELVQEKNPTGLNLNEQVPCAQPGAQQPLPQANLNLGPAPGVTVVGGRIIKTRKGKQSQKKRKTRRHRRRVAKKLH